MMIVFVMAFIAGLFASHYDIIDAARLVLVYAKRLRRG